MTYSPSECPRCGAATRVIRTTQKPGRTERTRMCESCEYVYKTEERIKKPPHEEAAREFIGAAASA